MDNDLHFSSKKQDYETPDGVFAPLNEEFSFVLDIAASKENAKCGIYITEETDALSISWKDYLISIEKPDGFIWCNPPYSNMALWSKKIREEAERGANIVVLAPARTQTHWFRDLFLSDTTFVQVPACQLRFLRPKITFVGAKNNAPFPSVIGVFGKDVERVTFWYDWKQYSAKKGEG